MCNGQYLKVKKKMKQNIKLQVLRLLFITLIAGILAVNSMFILEYIRTDDSNKISDINERFNEMNLPRVLVPDNNRNQKI